MGQYNWGGTVLACLYKRMCDVYHASVKVTTGPYMLFQLWAWERFPTIHLVITVLRKANDYSRGGRWVTRCTTTDAPQHVASHYQDLLSMLHPDQFIWMPYTNDVLFSLPWYCTAGAHIWRAKVPLIFWQIIEFHLPKRVMRQFGMRHDIPTTVKTDIGELHKLSLSSFPGRDWN